MPTSEVVTNVVEGLDLRALSLTVGLRTVAMILIGIISIRIFLKILDKTLARSKNLASIRGYVRSTIHVGLWFLLALVVLGSLGVELTSVIALLGVAGLAISLALQNTLSNLAGGMQLLLVKPFQVDDYVEADGVAGTITLIGLSNTTFLTYDNKQIFVPNSQLAATKIINYTAMGQRRVDVKLCASYEASTQKVKEAIQEVLDATPLILLEPAPVICLSEYQSSSIQYTVRVWTAAQDYWTVYYALLEQVRESFARHGVEMTYNHLNVHMMEKK